MSLALDCLLKKEKILLCLSTALCSHYFILTYPHVNNNNALLNDSKKTLKVPCYLQFQYRNRVILSNILNSKPLLPNIFPLVITINTTKTLDSIRESRVKKTQLSIRCYNNMTMWIFSTRVSFYSFICH
jgi:hypothetical protein